MWCVIHVMGWSQQQLFLFFSVPEQKAPVRWCYSLNFHNIRSTFLLCRCRFMYWHPLLLCVVIPSWMKNTLNGSLSMAFFMIPFLLSFFTLNSFEYFITYMYCICRHLSSRAYPCCQWGRTLSGRRTTVIAALKLNSPDLEYTVITVHTYQKSSEVIRALYFMVNAGKYLILAVTPA